jgi:homocysteine S-methyltransferase
VTTTSMSRELAQRPIVLDGGLATELENQGADLSGALWSARLLTDDPAAIVAAHQAFFAAGAQVATTASYQASYEGFARAGLDASQTDALLRRSVALARDAAESASQSDARPRWVAASVGPYGAMLADGSEYRGNYGLSVADLREFHRRRLEVLAAAQPDVIAIETIPELAEVEALVEEVERLRFPAWVSLTVARGRVRGGADLDEAFALAGSSEHVIAVGVNCSAPTEVVSAMGRAHRASRRVGVAYPNSGEVWDASARGWTGERGLDTSAVTGWLDAGTRLVGGCCRVRPSDIQVIADTVTTWAGPALPPFGSNEPTLPKE